MSEHAWRGVTIAVTADQKLEEVKSCMVDSGLWFSFNLVCACPKICSILKTIYILYCSFWKKTRTVLAVYFGGLFYSSVISFLLVHIRIWLRRLNMWTLTCPQYQIYQQTKKNMSSISQTYCSVGKFSFVSLLCKFNLFYFCFGMTGLTEVLCAHIWDKCLFRRVSKSTLFN